MTAKLIRTARDLLLGVGLMAVALILGTSVVPAILGYGAAVVTSGSMGEAVPVGSVVYARTVDVLEIKVGDVLTFRHDPSDVPTTHRVVSVTTEDGARVFTTKGDANATADAKPLVASRGHIPRVVRFVPFAGYALNLVRGPAGIALFIVLPALGLFFDWDRSRPRKKREAASVEAPAVLAAEVIAAEVVPAAPAPPATAHVPEAPVALAEPPVEEMVVPVAPMPLRVVRERAAALELTAVATPERDVAVPDRAVPLDEPDAEPDRVEPLDGPVQTPVAAVPPAVVQLDEPVSVGAVAAPFPRSSAGSDTWSWDFDPDAGRRRGRRK
jgi:signal peptidase